MLYMRLLERSTRKSIYGLINSITTRSLPSNFRRLTMMRDGHFRSDRTTYISGPIQQRSEVLHLSHNILSVCQLVELLDDSAQMLPNKHMSVENVGNVKS
jgi:hypothetical protein